MVQLYFSSSFVTAEGAGTMGKLFRNPLFELNLLIEFDILETMHKHGSRVWQKSENIICLLFFISSYHQAVIRRLATAVTITEEKCFAVL